MRALVCFQVGALRVDLAAPVELTPVYSPPAVRGRVPARESRLFRALCCAAVPDFDRQVQLCVRRHPAVCPAAAAASLRVCLRRGRGSADDGGAKRSRANQHAQWVGGKAVRRRELLGTVRSLAAGVRVHAVAVQDLAVLIVLLEGRRHRQLGVRLGLGLVPAGQDQLAPQVLLAVEIDVGRGDVGLALQVALQLQACLSEREETMVRITHGDSRHEEEAWAETPAKRCCAHRPQALQQPPLLPNARYQ